MDDESKTKKQLINELSRLRRSIAVLELELRKARQYLNLAGVMFIALDKNGSVILSNRKACEILECTEKQLLNRNWFEIFMRNRKERATHAKVSYQQIMKGGIERVEYFESPFHTQSGKTRIIAWHNALIKDNNNNIIGVICSGEDITERMQAEEALLKSKKELQVQTRNLEEVNTALRVLLDKRERDRTELEEEVVFNVEKLILPYLKKLNEGGLTPEQKTYLNNMESNLKEIISSFPHRLRSKYLTLTPAEITVAHLVKQGKRNKEITVSMNLSASTVEFHRKNVRKKLGLVNKKANLRSHLLSLK